jgi:thiamine kinase-like enzyme
LIVLNHNDLQENNILLTTQDNEKLVLIDLEYACLGPVALDLASFLNETVFDNQTLTYYPNNYPGSEERQSFCKKYLQLAYELLENRELSSEDYWVNHGKSFVRDVEKASLLKHF